mmetsp:Transcript_5535/g.8596  ORF Transcript_5535/g.8596 Transcript_5535/m.8596 type:complete len:134 (+) Transcript_5535:55-456(+)|eukprot:CAMPEP_0184655970 /NCGR_PEP_ID=MMETSP0308-20130426/15109_1 /TAXON_ID=38269 /ORGANISM="Gloeochaete witrockiana, Strain SAG 46.84" /LENGTH=133 /DNA_ID=CAMNT_0027092823 /DNA_START=50 /DNA_END=451 /DNA_ORIENTATION=-
MVRPLVKKTIIKKRRAKFFRQDSDRRITVKPSWRKPKGIDSPVRRRFKGYPLMPSIGYGSNKKTRHLLPNGLKKFIVYNVKDVELLLMHNRSFVAEIAHNVSVRKRTQIIERAGQLSVTVTNASAKFRTEDNE